MMHRNLDRRVEALVQVTDRARQHLRTLLDSSSTPRPGAGLWPTAVVAVAGAGRFAGADIQAE